MLFITEVWPLQMWSNNLVTVGVGNLSGLDLCKLKDCVLALVDSTLSLSFRIAQDEDLEGALQVACALENAVDVFITGDVKLAKRYGHLLKIKLITV